MTSGDFDTPHQRPQIRLLFLNSEADSNDSPLQ